MKLVLAGQPNCGKSTIFNAVAGYKAATANFPGTSLTLTSSRVLVEGREVEVVDLPGTYSLTVLRDEGERNALAYLLDEPATVLVNVVDATRLGRSLELTLQLIELRRPLVVALNMSDEAHRKGIAIDAHVLANELGARVVPTVAHRGTGLVELFAAALEAAREGAPPPLPRFDKEVEQAAGEIEQVIGAVEDAALRPARLAALKLLERDARVGAALGARSRTAARRVEETVTLLEQAHGWPGEQVLSGARHALAHRIEDTVSESIPPRPDWREKADVVLMHPVFGIPVLLGVLALFFVAVFGVGRVLEAPLARIFDELAAIAAHPFAPDTFGHALVEGVVLGLGGGIGIVLPYLLPFLAGLSALEDSGYLPRMAYLLDGVMHRIGLHGKSIVPLMLGYGCSVPAVLATRLLDHPRDRRLTALLTVMIPCSARTTVILGLVGAALGAIPALLVYVLNLAIVAGIGLLLQRRLEGTPPGLVLEVPDLRLPSWSAMFARTRLALQEFIVVAWPAMIVASVVLGLLEAAQLDGAINRALAPLTVTLLGLPATVGLTLVFGVLRKELALMMLAQALGTTAVATALTVPQAVSFALFVVFYVPCVATLAALWREVGGRTTLLATAITTVLAVVVAVAGRFAASFLASAS